MKIGLLFPGQGAQYPSMGYALFQTEPTVRKVFEEVSDACKIDVAKLCFSSSDDELKKTENAQLAVFTVSMSNYHHCIQYINEPYILAGHSLGELSALTAAGALSLYDAARLVYHRGFLMGKIINNDLGKMHAIIGLRTHIVEEIVNRMNNIDAQIACYNTPNQTIVAGSQDLLKLIGEEAGKYGAKIVELQTAAPFHTSFMKSISEDFIEVLHNQNFSMPKYNVISSVDGQIYTDTSSIIENLNKQFYSPVRWKECMSQIIDKQPNLVIDMGPGTVMESMTKWTGMKCYSVEEKLDFIKNIKIEQNIHTLKRCMGIAVCTPNKNWNTDAYYAGAIKPYQAIETMASNLESIKKPNGDEIIKALELLREIFLTKMVEPEEQEERFIQLCEETGYDEIINAFIKKHYRS